MPSIAAPEEETVNDDTARELPGKGSLSPLFIFVYPLFKPANIKDENNSAVVYVGSSLAVHNSFFFCSQIVSE